MCVSLLRNDVERERGYLRDCDTNKEKTRRIILKHRKMGKPIKVAHAGSGLFITTRKRRPLAAHTHPRSCLLDASEC